MIPILSYDVIYFWEKYIPVYTQYSNSVPLYTRYMTPYDRAWDMGSYIKYMSRWVLVSSGTCKKFLPVIYLSYACPMTSQFIYLSYIKYMNVNLFSNKYHVVFLSSGYIASFKAYNTHNESLNTW